MTQNPRRRYRITALLLAALAAPVCAEQAALTAPGTILPATGTVQIAFTPGDEADRILIDAIQNARRQILVQAFSFTHRKIAQALIQAKRRGVDVQLIGDKQQTWGISGERIADLAAAGVRVLLDGEHDSAHNKVMVIDQGFSDAVLVTGSMNFTYAAQYRNAENLLLFRGNPALVDAYFTNWKRHHAHAEPYLRLPQK